jgi:hypothetical protein
MRKTIKRMKRGGKSLGKGAHGEAFNVGENYEGTTFFSLISRKPIKEIVIHSPDGEKTHSSDSDLLQFKEYIRIIENRIAKVFLPAKNIAKDYLDEIAVNRKIVDIFGQEADNFLTISPLPPVFKHTMLGCVISFEDGEKIHAVFNTKCNNHYEISDLEKFANDILDSLIILQTQSYEHNDIKLDNIVKCEETYKLIDWGQATTVLNPEKKVGSLLTTSPIRWYILGYSHLNAKYRMQFRTTLRNSRFSVSKLFRETFFRIITEYNTITETTPDRDTLAKKYRYTFDVFMLGMTMLHAVFKYRLSEQIYLPIINKFTSLLDPVKNAFEAKELLISHLEKEQKMPVE